MSVTCLVPTVGPAHVDLSAEALDSRLVGGGLGVVWAHLAPELDIATAAQVQGMLGRAELRAPLIVLTAPAEAVEVAEPASQALVQLARTGEGT